MQRRGAPEVSGRRCRRWGRCRGAKPALTFWYFGWLSKGSARLAWFIFATQKRRDNVTVARWEQSADLGVASYAANAIGAAGQAAGVQSILHRLRARASPSSQSRNPGVLTPVKVKQLKELPER
jgi:hypothetical protein